MSVPWWKHQATIQCAIIAVCVPVGMWLATCSSVENQQSAAHAQAASAEHSNSEPQPITTNGPANEKERGNETGQPGKPAPCWHCFPMTSNDWLIIVTALGAVFVAWQAWETRKSAAAAQTSAETARLTAGAMMLAERAYLTLQHEVPGLTLVMFGKANLSVYVRNVGHTPARFTKFILRAIVYPKPVTLPVFPDYRDPASGGSGYLVGSDFVAYRVEVPIEGADNWQIGANGTHELHIIGYVDYIDAFSIRHRSGFARRYDPSKDDRVKYPTDLAFNTRDNLWVVVQPNYVYDRPRVRGEGKDWDEESQGQT